MGGGMGLINPLFAMVNYPHSQPSPPSEQGEGLVWHASLHSARVRLLISPLRQSFCQSSGEIDLPKAVRRSITALMWVMCSETSSVHDCAYFCSIPDLPCIFILLALLTQCGGLGMRLYKITLVLPQDVECAAEAMEKLQG